MNLNELRELLHSDREANYLMKVTVTHTNTEDGSEVTQTVRVADVFIKETPALIDPRMGLNIPARRNAWVYGKVAGREVTIDEKYISNITTK